MSTQQKFTWDYNKYNDGLSSNEVKKMISQVICATNSFSLFILIIKAIALKFLFDMFHRKIDLEKDAAKQAWENKIIGDSDTDVNV